MFWILKKIEEKTNEVYENGRMMGNRGRCVTMIQCKRETGEGEVNTCWSDSLALISFSIRSPSSIILILY